MIYSIRQITGALTFAALFLSILSSSAAQAAEEEAVDPGQTVAFTRSKGNCLACHMIADGDLPGSSGPPLLQMKLRFPDRDALRNQIWDATIKNPTSVMPPYGKNNILTEEEIDLIVDYLLTL